MICAPTSAKKCLPGLREADHYEPLSRGWTRRMTTDAEADSSTETSEEPRASIQTTHYQWLNGALCSLAAPHLRLVKLA